MDEGLGQRSRTSQRTQLAALVLAALALAVLVGLALARWLEQAT